LSVSFNSTYSKIDDVGSFVKADSTTTVEATFHGRIRVATVVGAGEAIFELRVDDLPTSTGRARASIKTTEAGPDGVQTSMTGPFSGLSTGTNGEGALAMTWRESRLFRIGLCCGLPTIGLIITCPTANAADLASTHYQLVSPTLSGGGSIALSNPGVGETDTAASTVAQRQPIGVSVESVSGRQLEMGFWHTPR